MENGFLKFNFLAMLAISVKNGAPVSELVAEPDDSQLAIDSFAIYEATMELGDEILSSMSSPLGSVDQQEGIVVRDKKVSGEPYKITGSFILRGLQTSFTKP
jgi:orotate phosphoribosyltransferase-like protein